MIKDKVIQNKCKPQMWRRRGTQARWKRQGSLSDKRVTLRTAGRLTALFTPTYCRPPVSVVTHVQYGYLK